MRHPSSILLTWAQRGVISGYLIIAHYFADSIKIWIVQHSLRVIAVSPYSKRPSIKMCELNFLSYHSYDMKCPNFLRRYGREVELRRNFKRWNLPLIVRLRRKKVGPQIGLREIIQILFIQPIRSINQQMLQSCNNISDFAVANDSIHMWNQSVNHWPVYFSLNTSYGNISPKKLQTQRDVENLEFLTCYLKQSQI